MNTLTLPTRISNPPAATASPVESIWKKSLRMHWLVPAAMVPENLRRGAAPELRAEARVGFRTGPDGRAAPCCELLFEGETLAVWGGRNPSGWGRAPNGGLETLEFVHDTCDVILFGEVRRSGKALRWKAFLGLYRAYAEPREGTRDCYLRGGDRDPAVALECDILEMELLLEAAPWLAAARYAGAHFVP